MNLVLLVVSLFSAGCLSSAAETERGCMTWTPSGVSNVCCESCKPGNRMVNRCGPDPTKLCVPCEPKTYTDDPQPKQYMCRVCTQCVGSHILKNNCTSTKDTECACKPGWRCGDDRCSFCVKECRKGEEPIKRSCQKCPEGTFNDQIHQKCQPWGSCPNSKRIMALGTAVSDTTCIGSPTLPKTSPVMNVNNREDDTKMIVAVAAPCVLLILAVLVLIIFKKSKTTEKVTITGPIIGTPTTDEPRSLMECSYHQPQQEQGSSSESLSSQDSKDQLIV